MSNPIYKHAHLQSRWVTCAADLCVEAYGDSSLYMKFDGTHGTHAILHLDNKDRTLYVAVRGTLAARDWVANVMVRKVKFDKDGSRVHRGFMRRVQGVWLGLLVEILRRQPTYDRIVFTGHSLGAAIATIMYSNTKTYGFPTTNPAIYLCAFASPRVGNGKYARRFAGDKHAVTFRDNNDIVTWIPVINFRRIAVPLIHFDTRGEFHVNPSRMFLLRDLFQGVWSAIRQFNFNPVQDHDMSKYKRLVWRLFDKQ